MFAKIQNIISKYFDPFSPIDLEKLKFMIEILINITYKDRKIKSEASLAQIKVFFAKNVFIKKYFRSF